ncbi:hypothetical protein [Mycolicibacterium brisbanense]|uniref:Uncharacterized protein n=1 Tax=Mycolicibacterium brisbanense TaxID=146020 RepID=A0A100W3Q6_9MYCO|nr:hypothetical protein [Mycolicibacterium brisbanense]GAS91061.1 uncharacterized protein RMCB_5157 [Mycolicibacterium brisbanense]
MPADPDTPVDAMTEGELAAHIYRSIDELSARGTREAFAELLRVVAYTGEKVGEAARLLATANSWAQVAEVSGTSKQAAWERWRS